MSLLCPTELEKLETAHLADRREALTDLRAKGPAGLEVFLAALPRRFGRELLGPEVLQDPNRIDLRAWRRCDLAAALLLAKAEDALLEKLFQQGDTDERQMVLRALSARMIDDATRRILEAAHRQNDEAVFRAAYADSALAAMALDDESLDRGILKAAFLGIDLGRLIGVENRARPELSAMLLDFMTEREAAGRRIWPGSLELAAHAPCVGVRSRILGDLWHGEDLRRYHAVRGARIILGDHDDEELRDQLRLRRERERAPFVLAALG
ncbi:MAG: EboA domain-containing protein [Planctomycetes bacterium]|nr:EboA domain-containing protein [Planctomycetota bacterium]